MSALPQTFADRPHAAPDQTSDLDAKGAMLLRVFETLEAAGAPWCILHGYQQYPANIPSDVDLLISDQLSSSRLAQILHAARAHIGGRIVQWFEDGAIFIVLASDQPSPSAPMLQLHVSRNYSMGGRVFFDGAEILHKRQRHGEFWTPAPAVEFSCVLINRVIKGVFTDEHAARLSELYAQDRNACEAAVAKFVGGSSAAMIGQAGANGNWQQVRTSLDKLRGEFLASPQARSDSSVRALFRKARRWLRPRNGFHVVFLGPDGVGKSTVIETFQGDIEQAFLHSQYLTFAPSLIPAKLAPKKSVPHELPPRSYPASLIKAAWWLVCYTLGYIASVHRVKARGGLVVNHRYLLDAIVDQKRYRYSGPVSLLRGIWKVSPKPDLVLLLDAPPEVIRARKSELPLEEIARQREAYRSVVTAQRMGRLIDASQPLKKVIADAEALVLDRLAERSLRQLKLRGGA